MSKYHSKKITLSDGTVFDSKKEYKRYTELQWLERAGEIRLLKRQVRFTLIPPHYEDTAEKGKPKCIERECCYVADFVYHDAKTGEIVVEDTKGFRTPEYIIKRKLMLSVYGIRIKEV